MDKKTALHYELPTKNCWAHTLLQPRLNFESTQFQAGRFQNNTTRPNGQKFNLFKWLLTRRSFTWNVDRDQEFQQFTSISESCHRPVLMQILTSGKSGLWGMPLF